MNNNNSHLSFQEQFETQYTYINGFMRNVMRYADRPALYDVQTDQSFTYQQLNANVNRLARALQADGVGNGDVVVMLLRNCAEFVFCYLATQKIGAVSCPMNYLQAYGEMALNIEDSEPVVLIYDSYFKEQVGQALSVSAHTPQRILMVNTTDENDVPQGELFFDVYLDDQPETEPHSAKPLSIYDETTRLYTSGTTSRPNGVPIYSINEVLSAHDVMIGVALSPDDRTMNLTPWFHRGGLHSCGPCATLYAGGEVMIQRDQGPVRCLEMVQKHQINFMVGTPSVFQLLCRAQERAHTDLSSLKGMVAMGAPLDRATCIRFQQVFTPNVYNGYGTTETFWNTFLRPSDLPDHAGSAGQSCVDDDVRIVHAYPDRHAEPDDLVARDGEETGEIIISSVAKTSFSYYQNEALTDRKFDQGFIYTGDLGTWDEQSYITICGRKDDMIVTAGENVHATQVESILNEHPKVTESCVVGVTDGLHGQIVAAYVCTEDPDLTIQELKEFTVAHPMISDYKSPKYYCICDELPHTATGKLRHSEVRKHAQEDLENGVLKRI